jgi:hypothetical protein
MMIQNYLDMDLRPLKFNYWSFYILVLFSYCENFYSFSSLLTRPEIVIDEIKAKVQKATPTPHTSSMDYVESYINGVKMLFSESNRKGMHTPMPISVS